MNFKSIFDKAVDLRLLAQRIVESAAGQEEETVTRYVSEADEKVSAIVTEIELDTPKFAQLSDPGQRETYAREMLETHHRLTTKYIIQNSIYERLNAKVGPHSDMTVAALAARNTTYAERERLIWTILELMGVDS